MNMSNLAHALLALVMQLSIGAMGMAFGVPGEMATMFGGLFAVGFYFGREVAQAERKAGTPPWWSGFLVTKWGKDAVFDLLCPAAACVLCCIVVFNF